MKPTSAFKLKKPVKTLLAGILDSRKYNEFKRLMIQSQLSEEEASRKPLKIKDKE